MALQAAEKVVQHELCRRLKADSESKIKHLDASLKASSTRTAQSHDFFSNLFSRAEST